jgi:tetratricopeptide (TPR) repeat protein
MIQDSTVGKFPAVASKDSLAADEPRLDSWKEIAAYLRREVRTVQLWEKHEGLPVHRHFHKRLGSVFALRSEIDQWRNQVSRTRETGKASGTEQEAAKNYYTIQCLPLHLAVRDEWQSSCRLLVSRTLKAIAHAYPNELAIQQSGPRSSNQALSSHSTGQAATVHGSMVYRLRWSFEEDSAHLRIGVSLAAADSDVEAWSHSQLCKTRDMLRLSSHLAEQIVQCLWLKMFSSHRTAFATRHQTESTSREDYLRGRYFWNQRNEHGLRKAIACFESAMRQNPQFALPYSGLADSLTLLSFYEIVSPSEVMPAARKAAQRAVELDPKSAEAHASLADVFMHFDRDWRSADREYRLAIQCDPEYALGYHWYANLLSARGQHEAARMAIMHALEINPVSVITLVWAGVISHLAHRFDDAIRHYQNALELDPSFIWAHMYLAQSLEQKGDTEAALQEFQTTARLGGGESHCVKAMMAHAHAAAGDGGSARIILGELEHSSPQHMPSYDIAATYAALGDSRHMTSWLNRACSERSMKLFALTQDPRFDPLRHFSGFKEIVSRVGLSQFNPVYS